MTHPIQIFFGQTLKLAIGMARHTINAPFFDTKRNPFERKGARPEYIARGAFEMKASPLMI